MRLPSRPNRRAAGRTLVSIKIAMDRSKEGKAATTTDPFRTVVFLWPINEPVDLAAIARTAGEACGVELNLVTRSSRDRRAGAAIPVGTIAGTIDVLEALTRTCATAAHPVRIIADFGPAIDAKGNVSDMLISRLAGASDMVGLPASMPIATMTFAARARAEPLDRVRFVPIGRTAAASGTSPGGDGDGRPLASREVYALSFIDRPPRRVPSRRRGERG